MADERILIVDDEVSIQRLLARLCQNAGYQVAVAKDGAGAFRALAESLYDICISDLRLPDTDGIEILRRAKQLQPTCEIIILTGHGDLETAVEALRLGAYDYLQKPVLDLQLIPIIISRALERQRLARHNTQLLQDLQRANQELEHRRRQEIQYINQIGQALAAPLHTTEVAKVVVNAILGSMSCDAAGLLLLQHDHTHHPWALVGAKETLSPHAVKALVASMVARMPSGVRPPVEMIETEELPPLDPSALDDKAWRNQEFRDLPIRDELAGVAIAASHSGEPFSEEAMAFFSILSAQATSALANARLFARTRELATRDSLTGLYNHGHFFELLEAEISRSERYGHELALIMLDIDRQHGLKTINDTYGHQAGDELLCAIARLMETSVRRADVVARYGGDEFIIMAPQTGREKGLALARRLCWRLRQAEFIFEGQRERVTASLGVGVFEPNHNASANSVVSQADQAMYVAKERGGDRVCLVGPDGPCMPGVDDAP